VLVERLVRIAQLAEARPRNAFVGTADRAHRMVASPLGCWRSSRPAESVRSPLCNAEACGRWELSITQPMMKSRSRDTETPTYVICSTGRAARLQR
jgi:hypothetical protein